MGLAPSEVVLCVVAVLGRYLKKVFAVTVGVVEVVAVVVHVARCLAVVAFHPLFVCIKMFRLEKVSRELDRRHASPQGR